MILAAPVVRHHSKLLLRNKEELETEIMVGDLIDTIEYDYPTFHLSMDCFWCETLEGALKLLEAESAIGLQKRHYMMFSGCQQILC